MARSNRNNKSKGRGQNRRRKGGKNQVDPSVFWGDAEKLPDVEPETVRITTNSVAVVKSLGRPPLSGQQNASEHYFTAVYDRAVNLGAALAAAGNLLDAEELTGD